MNKKDFDKLARGDIVRHKLSTENYRIDGKYSGFFLAVKTMYISNPKEWDLILPGTKKTKEE